MIKKLVVQKLFDKYDFEITINRDLTLLTGQNGSGKTTLLKLLWSLVTPNRAVAIREVPCRSARVETETYDLEFIPDLYQGRVGSRVARYTVSLHQGLESDPTVFDVCYDDDGYERDGAQKIRAMNALLEPFEFNTIFFPTFRLIEGGFSAFADEGFRDEIRYRSRYMLSRAFDGFSRMLSGEKHKFVSSISTQDVEDKLSQVYTEITEKTNQLYLQFSKDLERNADSKLEDLPGALEQLKRRRDDCNHPLEELSDLVRGTFKDRGIRISKTIVLGDRETAIDSKNLSAGEKQMFSFLSYNAFCEKTVIFIDEPELSLHVDWQRILFKKLIAQESTNQFVATTHSPFIYSRHSQSEYYIDRNRGWKDSDLASEDHAE